MSNEVTTALGDIRRDLGRLEAKIEGDDKSDVSWVKWITAVATMFTAVMAIYTVALEWTKNRIDIEQAPSIAEQTRLSNEKTALEIQKLLGELGAQTTQQLAENPENTEALISELRVAIDALSQGAANGLAAIFVTFLFFWMFFRVISIAEQTIQMFWQYIVFAAHHLANSINRGNSRHTRLRSFFVTLFTVTISQVPSLFFLYARVILLFGAVIPYVLNVLVVSSNHEELKAAVTKLLDFQLIEAINLTMSALGG